MKRLLSALVILLLPVAVLADGKAFPTIAFPANVTIPDQRALIHFANGMERLVIETRFTGSGTNFAWVIPLPGQPVIEEATTGLFPTLQYLFRPRIIHTVPNYYVGMLLVVLFLIFLRSAAKRSALAMLALLLLTTVFVAMLFPALSTSRGKSASMGSLSDGAVSILERKLVGIFETTIIASRDPQALQSWMRDNGFALSANSEPVFESYVKDNWVFVAAKIQRDHPDYATSTPHPLSFTFKTSRLVYPMRLTGVDNGPLLVDLYVFGPSRVKAPHFKVEQCTQPAYAELPSREIASWSYRSSYPPNIVHPLLRKWVQNAPVATKLTAKLSPAQMQNDVWLDWVPFHETRNSVFSRESALIFSANWGVGIFAAGLLVAYVVSAIKRYSPRLLSQLVGYAALMGILAGSVVYVSSPKIKVKLVAWHHSLWPEALDSLHDWLWTENTNMVARKEIQAQAQQILADATKDAKWLEGFSPYRVRKFDNFILGGRIHEEDSPGNFKLREAGGELEFVVYDHDGAEHVFERAWKLRQDKSSDTAK